VQADRGAHLEIQRRLHVHQPIKGYGTLLETCRIAEAPNASGPARKPDFQQKARHANLAFTIG